MIGVGVSIGAIAARARKKGAAPGPAPFPSSAFTAAGGFMVLDAEDNHGEAAIVQSFAPGDVNTATNTIALADRGFGVFTTVSSCKGTRGWFGTTGTLPTISGGTLTPGAAGSPGTLVYRVDLGGGQAKFYKEATDADYAALGSAVAGELIRSGQRYAEAIDPIDFTDGGSGTHTFYTWPLTNTLTTKQGGYTVTAPSLTDPNTWFEIASIGGKRYIANWALACSAYGSYRSFGKRYYWSDVALSQAGANKRWLWAMACVNMPSDQDRSVLKLQVSSGVDTTANTITAANPFTTGDAVTTKASPGSTSPGGLTDGATSYIRVVSNVMTFHPTNADALAGTNTIDLTTTGGTFLIYAPARTGDVVQHRMRFVSEYGDMANVASGGNGYNLLTQRAKAETAQHAATSVAVSGSTAGQITSGWAAFTEFDSARVRIWFPPGSTGPTRVDTGTALAAGLYYASRTPGGGSIRLHTTQQSAVEGIGVATVSTSCIKFSAAGTGEFMVFAEDTFAGVLSHWGDSDVVPARRTPYNYDTVWSSGVDMNKPGETYMKVYHGVNVNVIDETLTSTVLCRNTGAWESGSKPGALLNSGAAHVSLNGYLSALCWFAGTGDPDTANLQTVMDWMATRNGTRISASNTALPTISADPVPGTQIVGQVGGWSGPRPWAFAFQWQRADDAAGSNAADISGATSIRYTPAAADVDKHLRLKVSVTNRSGTTAAYSAWSNAVANDVGEAETAAFMARLSAEPVAGFRPLLKACYAALINASALAAHDSILAPFIYGVPTIGGGALTVADALLNLAGSINGTVVGTLTWTAKSGAEATDGTSTISFGLDPSSGALKYQRNSASIWHCEATTPSGNTTASLRNTNARVNLNPRLSGGTATLQLNATSATYTSAAQAYWTGFWCGLRRSSTAVDFIHDDVTLVADWAQPSQQVTAGNLVLGPKDGRKAYGGVGAGITIAQAQAARVAMEAFRTGVAAL